MTTGSFKHGVLGAGLACLLLSAGCGEAVRQGSGATYVVIESLQGARGGESSLTFTSTLQSDVQTFGGVFEDPGRVVLRVAPKDVTAPLSSNNWVTINRYRVVYRRADGLARQGVDVPYAFDGAVTFTVGDTGSASSGFTIVRAQAKLEAPLSTLSVLPQSFGGGAVISTLADVTFYGRDQVGNEVNVTGTIGINFADWADPSK